MNAFLFHKFVNLKAYVKIYKKYTNNLNPNYKSFIKVIYKIVFQA